MFASELLGVAAKFLAEVDFKLPFEPYTPITPHNSFTAAALFSNPAFSSAVSLISMICSIPFAPSLHGTPT